MLLQKKIIKSILVDEANNSTFITNEGIYGLGILRGKVAGNYKPKHIGATARKQFREEKIKELTIELNDLLNDKSKLEEEINTISNKKGTIIEEGNNFPSENELNNCKNIVFEAKKKLSISIEELETASNELEKVKKELIEIKDKCY